MATKMLRVPISELKTVRITCLKCNRGVIEVSTIRATAALDHGECRFCKAPLLPPSGPEPLNDLRLAIAALSEAPLSEKLFIEFEIAQPE